MLDAFIKKLPKSLVAIVAIGIGIAFILLNDPPHTFCDTQLENFKSAQSGILFKDPKDKVSLYPLMVKLLKTCRATVAPGACYEYFSYLNRLLLDFKIIVNECLEPLSQIQEVKDHLFIGVSTMVELAWREEVLAGRVSKLNWLKYPDLSLFCQIKKHIVLFYGRDTLKQFEQTVLSRLPNAKKASLLTIRKFSILSEPCGKYL